MTCVDRGRAGMSACTVQYSDAVADFELQGADDDETRVLHDRASGYAVALPGHPELVAPPDGGPRYDVVVRLRAIRAEHGFRIDELPTALDRGPLATALATSYATSRAGRPSRVAPLPAVAAADGAVAIYPLRDTADPTMEQVWIAIRPAAQGVWALYHTTRFRTADVNAIQWAHLRNTIIDQHRWDREAAAAAIWPASAIGRPSARLDLTDAAWREAEAKRRDVGALGPAEVTAIADVLCDAAHTELPPRAELSAAALSACANRLAAAASPTVAQVLGRNLTACHTALDLRGWAWQCAWAVGNRHALDERVT